MLLQLPQQSDGKLGGKSFDEIQVDRGVRVERLKQTGTLAGLHRDDDALEIECGAPVQPIAELAVDARAMTLRFLARPGPCADEAIVAAVETSTATSASVRHSRRTVFARCASRPLRNRFVACIATAPNESHVTRQ